MCKQCDDPDAWFSTQDPLAQPEPDWGSGIQLRLKRYVRRGAEGSGEPRGQAVLLLHGGSANHRTFTIENGLADWLLDKNLDPWLLDWRGSSLVSDCPQNQETLRRESTLYTFNRAASEDVPAAIARMRSDPHPPAGPIAMVGHCMGAAVIAEAVARGTTRHQVDRIVLLALGLFYEAAIDSRIKSEERILERLALKVEDTPCIDPRVDSKGIPQTPWPQDLDKLYEAWPSGLRAHDTAEEKAVVNAMCNRISFMYGMPYRHDNLAEGIHDVPEKTATGSEHGGHKPPTQPGLPHHFGGFPLQMYLHAARNLREGHATQFDPPHAPIVSDEARDRFLELIKVTLITGESNRLWHRDSIDRMHEWLSRGDSRALPKIQKHVLAHYAHQDLLWGRKSPLEVYPYIGQGLGLHLRPGDDADRAASAEPPTLAQ